MMPGATPRALARAALLAALLLVAAAAGAQEPTVRGRVLAAPGVGLAGAEVVLEPLLPAVESARRGLAGESPPAPVARTSTDAAGWFALQAPESGMWQVRVDDGGRAPAVFPLRPLGDDTTLPDLLAPPRRELVVRFVDTGGRRLGGQPWTARCWSPTWARRAPQGWWPATLGGRAGRDGRAVLACGRGDEATVVAVAGDRYAVRTVPAVRGEVELALDGELLALPIRDAGGAPAHGTLTMSRWPAAAFGVATGAGALAGVPHRDDGAVPYGFGDDLGLYADAEVVAGADGTLAIRLPPSRTVTGRVVDLVSGLPLAGAWAMPASASMHFQQTGRDGVFALRLPREPQDGPPSELIVGAPGHASVRLAVDAAVDRHEIALVPTAVLRGTVRDRTGLAVAAAEVVAAARHAETRADLRGVAPPAESAELSTRSAADGAFRLPPLPATVPIRLTASAPGYAPAILHLAPLGERPEALEVTLEPGFALSGRVVDRDGAPLAATLELARPGLAGTARSLTDAATASGPDGRFAFAQLAAGTYDLEIAADGHSSRRLEAVTLPADRDLGDLALAPAIVVSGRVVATEDGAALTGAHVALLSGERTLQRQTTGDDGSFRFVGVPDEAGLRVVASRDDRAASGQGATAEPLVLALPPATAEPGLPTARRDGDEGVRLAARVVAPSGEPVSRAEVELRSLTEGAPRLLGLFETDSAGRFDAGAIAGGRWRLRLAHPRYEPVELELAPDELAAAVDGGGLVLRFTAARDPEALLVAGQVLDAAGRPVADAEVGLYELASPDFPLATTRSYHDGNFELLAPEAGRRGLIARHPALGEARRGPLEVGDGALRHLELVLAPHAEVRGRIRGLEGRDPTALQLFALFGDESGGDESRGAEIAADGTFHVRALRSGTWRLVARLPSGRTWHGAPFSVAAGETDLWQELTLPPGRRVAGAARVAGLAAAGVGVRLSCDGMNELAVTDGSGGFRFHDVPTSACLVLALRFETGELATLHLAAGTEDRELELHLEPTPELLLGAVAEPPPGHLLVTAYDDAGTVVHQLVGEVGEDGWARLRGLPAGRWRLEIADPGGRRGEVRIDHPGPPVTVALAVP